MTATTLNDTGHPVRTLGLRLDTAIRRERRAIARLPLNLDVQAEMDAIEAAAAPVLAIYEEIQSANAPKAVRARAIAWFEGAAPAR